VRQTHFLLAALFWACFGVHAFSINLNGAGGAVGKMGANLNQFPYLATLMQLGRHFSPMCAISFAFPVLCLNSAESKQTGKIVSFNSPET
jgi:hypothetical protein